MMRKVKRLEKRIEELKDENFALRNKIAHLEFTIAGDDAYRDSLKKEITKAQNKYIIEVQKNVVLADTIVHLRDMLTEAERQVHSDE